MAKQLVKDTAQVFGRYSDYTRDELVEEIDRKIKELPEAQRASARFDIEIVNYQYDDGDYPYLVMNFERPETDDEEQKREAQEAFRKKQIEERDRKEFERLSKQFANK